MTCGVCRCRVACKAAPSARCSMIKIVNMIIDADIELYKLDEKHGTSRTNA